MHKHTKLGVQWLYNILEGGETDKVDFKAQLKDKLIFGKSLKSYSPNYDELAKDVVAFANYKGGFIVVGIQDGTKDFNSEFKFEDEEIFKLVKNIQARTNPSITVIPHKIIIEDSNILVIEVPFSMQLHSTTKGEYLIRNMDGNKPIGPHEIVTIQSEKNLIVYDQKTWLLNYKWEDLDKTRLLYKKIKEVNSQSPYLKSSQQEFCDSLGLIKELGENVFPTTTGIVFIGNEKALRELPYNFIKYIKYNPDGSYTPHEYKGDLISIADQAFSQLKSEIQVQEIQFGLVREYIEDYPEIVLRELLINALAHRDYSRQQIIEIRKYDSYIEFESPGSFPDGITADNCLRKTNPRNPNIMDIFREIKYAEKAGSGFDKIFTALLTNGKSLPIIEQTDSSLIVRVFSASLEKEMIELNRTYREIKKRDIDLDKLLILDYLLKNKKLKLKDFDVSPYINKHHLKRVLSELIDIEFVETTGKSSDLHYIIHKSKRLSTKSEKEYLLAKKQDKQKQIEAILRYLDEFKEIDNNKARELLTLSDNQTSYISRLFKEMVEKELIVIDREDGHNRRIYKRT